MPVNSPQIMLVEDNPQFLYLMQRYAQSAGCRLMHVADCAHLLAAAAAEQPDLILLDLGVAGVDGESRGVLAGLKQDPATHRIPVYLCSASELAARGLEEYADGLLLKPVMYDDFEAALASAAIHAVHSD
jgi:CheY-like chemotaxis protein